MWGFWLVPQLLCSGLSLKGSRDMPKSLMSMDGWIQKNPSAYYMPADERAAFEAGLAYIRAPEAQETLCRLNARFKLSTVYSDPIPAGKCGNDRLFSSPAAAVLLKRRPVSFIGCSQRYTPPRPSRTRRCWQRQLFPRTPAG